MSHKPQVFLSYAHEDRKTVLSLYKKLLDAGFQPCVAISCPYGGCSELPWERLSKAMTR
jgi:hypothetical protein